MHKLDSKQITEGVIWKQLLRFFFPILLGNFFQQMYNTVDAIIVGRFIGTQGLAAVGANASLIAVVIGFFIGISSGTTVIVAQYYGANDHRNTRSAMHTGIVFAALLGLTATILGLTAGPHVLRLINTPENCIADATTYLRIYFCGSIASMVYEMGSGILRAMGDSRRPLIFLIISCITNILLDLLFVVVFKLGVAGAAMATVMSQMISAVLVLCVLCRLPESVRLLFRMLRIQAPILKRILSIGLPAGLQLITFDLSSVLIQSGINSFGDVTMAAWTTYIKSDALTWMICGSFGVAVTTFVGQNFGAEKYARIRQSVWVCMGMGTTLVALSSATVLVFREFILGIYSTDLEVIQVGSRILLTILPFNIVFVPVEVFAGAMRGTGYSIVPTLITALSVCLIRVPWALIMANIWHTVEVLAFAYPISWILAAIVFFFVYARGTWLRRRIEISGNAPEIR